jgi:hypothetical protein
MAIITKELALKIVKKLGAHVKITTKAHDIAEVFHQGKLIATFGIRRGSNKNLGHDHIPHQIFVGARDAKLLGQCPLSREQWLQIITEKGMVE